MSAQFTDKEYDYFYRERDSEGNWSTWEPCLHHEYEARAEQKDKYEVTSVPK